MLFLLKYSGRQSTALVAALAKRAINNPSRVLDISCLVTKNGFFLVGYPKEVGLVIFSVGSDEAMWEVQENSPIAPETAVNELVMSPPADPGLIKQLPPYAQKMFIE